MIHSMVARAVLAFSLCLTACASQVPASRLDPWIGEPLSDPSTVALPTERPVRASLVFLDPAESEPMLPDDVRVRITDQLREEISQAYPLVIERIIPSREVRERRDLGDVIAYAKDHGVRFVMVVMLSSVEQEYPVSLFLGWTTHRQPGLRRDNWTLAEAALIDVEREQIVLRAEGRAWATLDLPSTPGINQWYPVIYLRPQDPERRIWPPTYEGAPITLRMVSATRAVKRLVLDIRRTWNEKRHLELAGVKG